MPATWVPNSYRAAARTLLHVLLVAAASSLMASPMLAQLVPLTTGRAVSGPPDSTAAQPAQPPACVARGEWRQRKLSVLNVARSARQAEAFFGASGLAVGRTAVFSAAPQSTRAYTEVVSDFLRLGGPLGYARLGFGAQLSDTKRDTSGAGSRGESSGLDAFLGAGGNTVMFLAAPLVHYESRAGGCAASRFDVTFVPRAAASFQRVNSALTDSRNSVLDLGVEAQWVAVSVGSQFRLYGLGRVGHVWGDAAFYQSLGLPVDAHTDFGYARWELGIDIANHVRISMYGLGLGPASLSRRPSALQVQVVR